VSDNVEIIPTRDTAISIIRVLAFLSIITCHIMQYYDCELAWWFNVGVQIFLCISGYLYGKKEIADNLAFYKKQFVKILVPYYIVVVTAIIAQLIFARTEISIAHIAKALLVCGTLNGGEHLWFIPTILFCYLLTPLFNKINNLIFEKRYPILWIVLFFVVLNIGVEIFIKYFNPAWISCFYFGHVLGKNEIKQRIKSTTYKSIIYVSAFGLVTTQISIDYILYLEMPGIIGTLYNAMCDYGHTFLGIAIVVFLHDIFTKIEFPKLFLKPISFLDVISYEGYLVHQFFVFGPFSLFKIINQPIVTVMAIFAVTFCSGRIIKFISDGIKKLIK